MHAPSSGCDAFAQGRGLGVLELMIPGCGMMSQASGTIIVVEGWCALKEEAWPAAGLEVQTGGLQTLN